jgi:hypothetical protein
MRVGENGDFCVGTVHSGRVLLSSDSLHGGLLPLSKEMMSNEAVKSSADHRPSAVDPEDNQYKVERLVGKRRMRGKVQYLSTASKSTLILLNLTRF